MVVDVGVRARGDRLCLAAYGDGELVFERGYPSDDGVPASGSLTFVAGDRVSDRVRVSGWLSHGGQIVARDSGESGFGELDSVHLPLDVARCHLAPGRGAPTLRSVDTFEAADALALEAIDADGDGRDELVIALADGTLAVVDAAAGEGEVRSIDATLPAGARPAIAASLADDCFVDLVLASPEGAVVLRALGRDASADDPIELAASGVAIGALTDEATLAIAGTGGLAVVALDGGATTMLETGPHRAVAIGDLTRDGYGDLVAVQSTGARVYLGSGAGPVRIDSALPASFATVDGPVAIGDLDGDGALDVVSAAGATLRVARNRGDGLLEDRSGAMPPAAAASIVEIVVVDFDGDCRDDVVLLDADGTATAWRSMPGLAFTSVAIALGPVADVAAADVDADRLHELAFLARTGELSVWER